MEVQRVPEPEVPPPPEPHAGDPVEVVASEVDGIRFLEVVFGDAEPGQPLPTLWLFHGRGDRARVPGGPFWALSRPVRIFVPEAPTPLGEGFTWLPYRVAEGRTEELAVALDAMADRLAALVARMAEERPTVGRPIVAGFSQGGVISYALALRHPELVGWAFPNAGWLPPQLVPALDEPSRFPPIRAIHGAADSTVPYEPTRQLIERLTEAGLDVDLWAFEGIAHVMTADMDARFRAELERALEALARAPDPSPSEPVVDPSEATPDAP